jgi:pimeloyl-ACP methyl ester carboxylesterase
MRYIYLHGFASSPQSTKARDLSDRFSRLYLPLLIPDLNQDDFTHLTLTRQLHQVGALFPSPPVPVTLIGSSLGGLTAAWLGQQHPQVERLVLLAPALGFLENWLSRLGTAQVQLWQTTGYLPVYHYREDRLLPLSYQFVKDAQQYRESELKRSVPTLILHGRRDEVIPLQASIEFARDRPWVKLIQLDTDHAMTDVSQEIWQNIREFCLLIS